MKAVGYHRPLPITDPESLVDLELPEPVATGHDLLVSVRAVSVNPVDTKVRRSAAPADGTPRILGFDAAGVVTAVGPEVTRFAPGDEVYYAGSIARSGTNAELHLVDERIVGRKPARLGWSQAAALPLTAITAWELLFDRLRVERAAPDTATSTGDALLVVGGAGGVGSILIQLARRLTGLTVIATASRPETRQWCESLGAHHVIDHSQPLGDQLQAIGIPAVRWVASLTATGTHFRALADALAPQGAIAVIDDPGTLDVMPLKRKSGALHWEFMFTRPVFGTPDMIAQHELLNEVSALADAGVLRTTMDAELGPIDAEHLRQAHALIESGRSRGKVVLAGF